MFAPTPVRHATRTRRRSPVAWELLHDTGKGLAADVWQA